MATLAKKEFYKKNVSGKLILMVVIYLSVTLILPGKLFSQNELNVLKGNWLYYTDAENFLYHHLTGQAYDLLEKRSETVAKISSLEEWKQRQQYIKETLLDIVGPFPEKNPLNPKIVRTIKKDGFRVEHIIYESQPGNYVTSSMFIPESLKKGDKAPAVIYCSGHSAEGYRSQVYLHVISNLAKKGFIVFAFDPVGQGERLQYIDESTGKSLIPALGEHSYAGCQSFITGSSQARYMIWDGIRAVDYLLSRPEVDPERIGITGRSGGGTQSAYISAMDERIYAAAPENYLTNFKRLLQTIGPQDAEQNMFNIIYRGLDQPDYLIVRAPKPALMITTTRDIFSIQGVRETEKEASGIYKAYNKEENFSRTEDDAPHASTVKNREAMYAFFQKHLNNPGNPLDEETEPFTPEEVRVTSTGQVITSLKGETNFSMNLKDAEKAGVSLDKSRSNPDTHFPRVLEMAKNLSGYREPSQSDEPIFHGRFQQDGYFIEKYFIKGEGEYVIPYLLFLPEKSNNQAMIFLNPAGKPKDINNLGEVEWLVKNGFTVLAPDMLGTGETGPEKIVYNHSFIKIWYASMLVGRSIVGIHAGDVVKLVNLLQKRDEISQIRGFARKDMAPVLLHAAAFCPDISSVALIEPYSSYISIVSNKFYNPGFIYGAVPHALKAYDLPDLAASLAPRKLLIAGATDGNDNLSGENNRDLLLVRSTYKIKNAANKLSIIPEKPGENLFSLISEWIK